MVEYEDQDAGRLHRFGYDCFGRRISKVTDADCVAFSTRVHHYVNGGQMLWQVLEEYESTPPCPCGGVGEDPCPPMALAASFVYGNYIDEVISMRRDVVAPAGVEDYFFFADDLFNVTCLTDSSGAVVERYRYGDYGTPTIRDTANPPNELYESAFGNTRLWNGREFDREINFYHYRTRYLEPSWGRFTTRDTIGIWGDPANHGNGLAYVGGNPWSLVDPTGLGALGTNADAVYAELSGSLGGAPGWFGGAGISGTLGFQFVVNCRSNEFTPFFFVQGTASVGSVGPTATANGGLGLVWDLPTNSDFSGWSAGVSITGSVAAWRLLELALPSLDALAQQFGFTLPPPVRHAIVGVVRNPAHGISGTGTAFRGILGHPYIGLELTGSAGTTGEGITASAFVSRSWQILASRPIPSSLSFVCMSVPAGCGAGGQRAGPGLADVSHAITNAARVFQDEIGQQFLYTPLGPYILDPFDIVNWP